MPRTPRQSKNVEDVRFESGVSTAIKDRLTNVLEDSLRAIGLRPPLKPEMPWETRSMLLKPTTLDQVYGPHAYDEPKGGLIDEGTAWVQNPRSGTFDFHPSSGMAIRNPRSGVYGLENPPPAPITPVKQIQGLTEFGLTPEVEPQFGEFGTYENIPTVSRVNYDKPRSRMPEIKNQAALTAMQRQMDLLLSSLRSPVG